MLLHLQRFALRSTVRNWILLSHENLAYPPPFQIRPRSIGFDSSSRWHNELPKSPFQTFVDVLKEELQNNQELQDNVKQLEGDVKCDHCKHGIHYLGWKHVRLL